MIALTSLSWWSFDASKPSEVASDDNYNDNFYQLSNGNSPQWGAADAEIKVPSGENTELKRSPCKAWSTSVYSRTCYTYCQGFLP